MAGLICRSTLSLTRRHPLVATVRCMQKRMADPMEHATGLERKELEAFARGNMDPFDVQPMKVGPSSRDKPNIVNSFHEARIVGCICHEDAFYINYMWLYKGGPQRCECGHWFQLGEAKDPFDFSDAKK